MQAEESSKEDSKSKSKSKSKSGSKKENSEDAAASNGADDLGRLGDFLRQEREKRGLTIEQVASATKINMKLVSALEADQYSELPALPFVRGFVISYCRFIGADSKQVLKDFDPFLARTYGELPSREGTFSGYAFEKKATDRSRTILLAVMGGFILLGAVVIVILKPSLRPKRLSHIDQLREVHGTPTPVPVQGPKASEAGGTTPELSNPTPEAAEQMSGEAPAETASETKPEEEKTAEAEKTEPKGESVEPERKPAPSDPLNKGDALAADKIIHKTEFKALVDVWVRYRVDDKRAMRLLLKKGNSLVLRAETRIRFQASNAKSLQYKYNKSEEFVSLDDSKEAFTQNFNKTIIFPFEGTENIRIQFPGMSPLPKTDGP